MGFDTVEVWGSSPHVPTISFSGLRAAHSSTRVRSVVLYVLRAHGLCLAEPGRGVTVPNPVRRSTVERTSHGKKEHPSAA